MHRPPRYDLGNPPAEMILYPQHHLPVSVQRPHWRDCQARHSVMSPLYDKRISPVFCLYL